MRVEHLPEVIIVEVLKKTRGFFRGGVLPDFLIRKLIKSGFIKNASGENINPASLDLRLTEEIYRVNGLLIPRTGEKVRDLLKDIEAVPYSFSQPLEKEVVYLARLREKVFLPRGVYGLINPKSSTGRCDVHVRVLVDGVSRYDSVYPTGGEQELWVAIVPKSFPVLLYKGLSLTQVRFFIGESEISSEEIKLELDYQQLLWEKDRVIKSSDLKIKDTDQRLILTIDANNVELVGMKYNHSGRILDFSKVGFYEAGDFFEPVSGSGKIRLKRGEFYILSTKEALKLNPWLAAEIITVDERAGDFRVHYAGFVDPGWGYGKDGKGRGRKLTLEIRPFEDLVIRDGQPICKLKLERMIAPPDLHYDKKESSNYKYQNKACLSKHFKAF